MRSLSLEQSFVYLEVDVRLLSLFFKLHCQGFLISVDFIHSGHSSLDIHHGCHVGAGMWWWDIGLPQKHCQR